MDNPMGLMYPPDGIKASELVRAKTNPLTGVIEILDPETGLPLVVSGGGYTPLPLNARIVHEGDSLTDYEIALGQNWQFFFHPLLGGRAYRPVGSNLAVGGQKISSLLGDGTWIADTGQIAAVVAKAPDLVTLMAGTNDISAGFTDPDAMFPFVKTACSGYFAGGAKYVIVGKVPPRNPVTDTTWTAAKEAVRVKFNALIATLPKWDKRVLVAETDTDNAGGSWDLTAANTSYQADGIHGSWLGMRIIAHAFYQQAVKLFDGVNPVTSGYLASDNLLTNAALYGTAGSVIGNAGSGVPVPTGVVADSWTFANNMVGVNVACSKSTLNGAVAQQLVLSGTVGSAAQQAQFQINQAYSGLTGEGYELAVDFELAAGHTNIRNIYIACDTSTTAANSSTTPFPSDQILRGTLRTRLTTPLAAGDVSNAVRMFITANSAGAATAADIKFSRPYLRKITAAVPQ